MVGPSRIDLAGGLYHVTSRDDRREHIYRDDADRNAWQWAYWTGLALS
jgi:putative transposase